ncbi:ribosome small subunit-dependent GTPase A [Streptomonospora nanhaiensis]|uniref:Small ribosomal subunit biogenesis GTPase RsgA n=1 Tax=Streptomonospora nanhaiensis TaxID=1323731 RepID=A0A853BT94_9ACTN|nr:ribosome small subunit-dependent GTPase A [Streptomonospora nanhaiensis]MBV2362705.1 ribosome small subunit-dependent GTPase A [Streptomonospora nanhaiensis]NYI97946.1 ribosome biogenesis GTPase [Streptomonospora nanhaiensis]
MSGGRRPLDEDDVRVRARGGSRPRTRIRPKHEDAREGFVTAVDRGRYRCLVEDRPVVAMKARELGRGSIVVGDRVALVGDLSGRPDTLARVVRVEERRSVLRRTADDTDPVERVIVANADQLVIVAALADPDPQPRFIDRCLVAAVDAGLDPLLCLTKADLAGPDDLLRTYAGLDVPHVVTRRDQGLDALSARLAGRTSVLIGSSGVGKSTLVNLLVPAAARAVGDVNPVTGRGRHTSTSAVALPFEGGWIIDTPGVRSFGLAHISPDDVVAGFADLAEAVAACPPGCPHTAGAPGCGLDAGVADGVLAPDRVASLRRLLSSREPGDDRA